MIRPFLIMLVVLVGLMVMTILKNHDLSNRCDQAVLSELVVVTHYATPALGVGFDVPQALIGAKVNPIYPELPSTSTLGFVYVQ